MRVFEIFRSIDGEVNACHQGRFTVFVRFAGCNLKCSYCDIAEAQPMTSGKKMSVEKVIEKVEELGGDLKKVTLTGGEPLIQKEIFRLTKELTSRGYEIVVETNGTIPLVGYGVSSWVVDFKLPSSGEYDKSDIRAFEGLGCRDFVKFVISDFHDFNIAVEKMSELKAIGCGALFAFSPVHEKLKPRLLYEWLDSQGLGCRVVLNLQIHKYLGVA